jgi:hypothetical protein
MGQDHFFLATFTIKDKEFFILMTFFKFSYQLLFIFIDLNQIPRYLILLFYKKKNFQKKY